MGLAGGLLLPPAGGRRPVQRAGPGPAIPAREDAEPRAQKWGAGCQPQLLRPRTPRRRVSDAAPGPQRCVPEGESEPASTGPAGVCRLSPGFGSWTLSPAGAAAGDLPALQASEVPPASPGLPDLLRLQNPGTGVAARWDFGAVRPPCALRGRGDSDPPPPPASSAASPPLPRAVAVPLRLAFLVCSLPGVWVVYYLKVTAGEGC